MRLSPRTTAALHLILVPGIFVAILMFSGNIKSIVGIFWDETWAEFDDVFYYALFFVFFANSNYLFRWKKTATKQYFENLTNDYIISERVILEKARKISLVIIIALLVVVIIQTYSGNGQNKEDPHAIDLIFLLLFSVLFASFITFSNSYYKISNQDSKKHFRLFVASGYFKKAMKVDDDIKTQLIEKGLKWLNEHYKKKKHLHIEDLEKINLKIIDENSQNEKQTIKEISEAFESGIENSALDIIADLMGIKTLDLLVKDSVTTRIKEWIIPIATIIIAIGAIVTIAKTFSLI